jgi:hypothetical protein
MQPRNEEAGVESPIPLSAAQWEELATGIDLLIFDLTQTYGDGLDESQLAYRLMLQELLQLIGECGEKAAIRGTRRS